MPLGGEFLGVWLDMRTLVNLDWAFCNHKLRDQFLEWLAASYCIHSDVANKFTTQSVSWFLSRQVKLKSLKVSSGMERTPATLYLREHGKNIRSVDCPAATSPDPLDLVALYTHSLVSFAYCRSPARENLTEVLWFNPQLRELKLNRVSGLYASHFNHIKLTHLRLLSLEATHRAEGLLQAIVGSSGSLTHIELARYTGLNQNAWSCPLLRCIGLGSLPLSDTVLALFATRCTQITHLNIAGNESVTDDGILKIAQNLTHLCGLGCGWCPLLTDQSLAHLAEHSAGTLEVVRMNGFRSARESVFVDFLQRCTKLHTLSTNLCLTSCVTPNMRNMTCIVLWSTATDTFLAELAQHCQKLEILCITNSVEFYNSASTAQSTMLGENVLLEETLQNTTGVIPFTEKGLMKVVFGLTRLRKLVVVEKVGEKQVTKLAVRCWQMLRPSLQFGDSFAAHDYNILEQE